MRIGKVREGRKREGKGMVLLRPGGWKEPFDDSSLVVLSKAVVEITWGTFVTHAGVSFRGQNLFDLMPSFCSQILLPSLSSSATSGVLQVERKHPGLQWNQCLPAICRK